MEAANHSKNSAMEAENHVKHGARSKSLMSRGVFFRIACFALMITVFNACGGGSGRGGTNTQTPTQSQTPAQATIAYDKGPFTKTGARHTINVESIEIIRIGRAYHSDAERTVTFRIVGKVTGSNVFNLRAKCYDADGFVVSTPHITASASDGERFRAEEDVFMSSKTVRIEFEIP